MHGCRVLLDCMSGFPDSVDRWGVLYCLGNHRGHDPARRHLFESLARLVGLALDADRLAARAQDAPTSAVAMTRSVADFQLSTRVAGGEKTTKVLFGYPVTSP